MCVCVHVCATHHLMDPRVEQNEIVDCTSYLRGEVVAGSAEKETTQCYQFRVEQRRAAGREGVETAFSPSKPTAQLHISGFSLILRQTL